MGIYVFEPGVLKYITKNGKMDFPDLINKLINSKEKVAAYLSEDKWLDIGQHDDYEIAQNEFNLIKDRLFDKKP
jgi:NDP-sugar pyrophosphorylase family protein